MSKAPVLLVVAISALALAASAVGALPKVQALGMTQPGCPIDAVSPYAICLQLPHRFTYWATPTGVGQRAKGLFLEQPLLNGLPTTTRRGVVRCLNVVGNAAVIGGRFTAPLSLYGLPFAMYVVDNGPPGSATPDLEGELGAFPPGDPDWIFLPASFPKACPAPTPSIYGYLPFSSGDAIVR
jgi:hypothetical protein